MTYEQIGIVTFDEVHADNIYTYGSEIQFVKNGVRFRNPLMPPSRPIFKWSSRYNYQANRRSPELPLLIPKKKYRLEIEAQSIPEWHFYLKVTFINRQGEILDNYIQRTPSDTFTCPKGTFIYEATLFSGGCEEITFKELRFFEEDSPSPIQLELVKAKRYKEGTEPDFLERVAPLLKQADERLEEKVLKN